MTHTTHDAETTPSWDPAQYLKFANERFRAAVELLERVPITSPRTIVDLGCGTGEITRLIANHWPTASVTGIDESESMLDMARAHAPGINWQRRSIDDWRPNQSFDLIYANATLQWLADHNTLIPRLIGCLHSGGCLAIQMPLSWHSPSHELMRTTLANGGPNGDPIGTPSLREAMERQWVADAQWYYDVLSQSANHIDIWETEYLHVFDGEDPVLEWVRGAGLRPILSQLSEQDLSLFLQTYRQRLRAAYPRNTRGKTTFPFRRIFMLATV